MLNPVIVRRLHEYADPNCKICGGIGYVGYEVPYGHPKFGKTDPCECWAAAAEQMRRANLGVMSNMFEDELGVTFDSLIDRNDTTAEMIKAGKEFAAGRTYLLTLCGGVGLGKTATLCAVVNDANAKDYGCASYVRFTDLLGIIRKGFKDSSSDDKYQKLLSIPVLAIDELDKAKNTEWAEEFRTMFFDDRYRQARNRKTKTILAMNGDATDLPEHIYDRLRFGEKIEGGFRIIRVTGTSARPSGL